MKHSCLKKISEPHTLESSMQEISVLAIHHEKTLPDEEFVSFDFSFECQNKNMAEIAEVKRLQQLVSLMISASTLLCEEEVIS